MLAVLLRNRDTVVHNRARISRLPVTSPHCTVTVKCNVAVAWRAYSAAIGEDGASARVPTPTGAAARLLRPEHREGSAMSVMSTMSYFRHAGSQTASMLKRFGAAACCVAMLAGAAACGTSDASDTKSGSGSSSSSSTAGYDVSGVKKDASIAALLPDSVTKDGKLTVGMDTSYAPAEFLAEDGKTPVGYDVDIVKAMANIFGLKADPVTANFDSIIPSVGSKYDIGVSSFTVTNERLDSVDFVTFYKAGSTWVTKKGNPEKVDTSDLCGKKIAVQTGTTQEESVAEISKQCKANGKQPVDVLSSKLQTDVTTNVVTCKAVAFYADTPVAGYAISQTGDQLATLGEDEGVAPEGAAIKKGDSATDEAVQKALQKLMDDGTYRKILKHWGAEGGAVTKAEINPKVED